MQRTWPDTALLQGGRPDPPGTRVLRRGLSRHALARMPTHLHAPRWQRPRLYHRPMEVQRLHRLLQVVQRLWTLLSRLPRTRRVQRLRVAAAALMTAVGWMSVLPRINDCPARAKRPAASFDDEEFRGHFKFRKADFMRVLAALGLTTQDAHKRPVNIRVGRPGTHCVVPADWALMVLVKRLATGGRYRDLAAVLGGGKTVLCNTFVHMLQWMHGKYKCRLRDLKFFRNLIPEFARLLENLSQHLHGTPCPFTNLVGFVDGHLVATARPGGDGCVHPNMYDTDVYNGNKKVHGLKYQVLMTLHARCLL